MKTQHVPSPKLYQDVANTIETKPQDITNHSEAECRSSLRPQHTGAKRDTNETSDHKTPQRNAAQMKPRVVTARGERDVNMQALCRWRLGRGKRDAWQNHIKKQSTRTLQAPL